MTPSNSRHLGLSFVAAAILLLARIAEAHPGHALSDHGASHVLTSPYHLAGLGLLAVAGVALFVAGRFVQNRTSRFCMRGAGVAALTVAGVCWGLLA